MTAVAVAMVDTLARPGPTARERSYLLVVVDAKGVSDLFTGLLDVALCLVGLAFSLEVFVAGRLTTRFLAFPFRS